MARNGSNSRKAVERTFAGLVDDRFELGEKLSVSNRLHVYKIGSGEDAEEHVEEVRDVTFFTRHTFEQFKGSDYETAVAFDPHRVEQQEIEGMESVEMRAQPVKAITIGREEKTYGVVFYGGRKDIVLEPQHGLELKQVEITSQHPISLLAKWTAKGVPWKQIAAPLMELAHNGALSVQLTPFSAAQVDTLKRKERARKSHPGQTDLTEQVAEDSKPRGAAHREKYGDGDEVEPPKRKRGRPPKAKVEMEVVEAQE